MTMSKRLTWQDLKRIPTSMLEHAIDHNAIQLAELRRQKGSSQPTEMATTNLAMAVHECLEVTAWLQSEVAVREMIDRCSRDKTPQ